MYQEGLRLNLSCIAWILSLTERMIERRRAMVLSGFEQIRAKG